MAASRIKAKAKPLTKRPPEKAAAAAPATCCDDVCKNVAAGKLMLVVCDGNGMRALQGTADGQYPAWDNVNQTWVLANV